jgi:hypothetical protein
MKVTVSPISSGRVIVYDARPTSSSIGSPGSSQDTLEILYAPVSHSWVGNEVIVIGGTCDGFGEIIREIRSQYENVTISVPIGGAPSEGSVFNVTLSGDVIYDSAVSGGTVRAAGSTSYVFQLQNLAPGVNVSSWVGAVITMQSHTQYGNGGTISSQSGSGNVLLDLLAPMPTTPSAAEYVIIARTNVVVGSRDTSFPEPIALSFTTSIESGYESCDARIPTSVERAAFIVENSLGKYLEVIDDVGRAVWEGVILSASADESGVYLRCVGVMDALNHETYSRVWPTDAVVGGTTPIDVLVDVISSCSVIRHDFYEVDGTGAIKANHQGLGSYEFDYSETGASLREVLDDVLRFGDGSSDFNPIYLQVWGNRLPVLLSSVTQSKLDITNPKWVVNSSVQSSAQDSASLEVDASSMKNKVSVVYTDLATGAQNRTAFRYDLESVLENGSRETIMSQGGIDSGNAIGVAGVATGSLGRVTRFAPVTIYDRIAVYGGAELYDSYMVRAGDIIYMPIMMDVWTTLGSSHLAQSKYVIARTSYNAITNELVIEPHVVQDRIDVYMAGVI